MNWVGDLIQKNIEETDTVLDLGCGIMQPLLDVIPSYPKTRLKCKRIFGVDIHQPYLDFLNKLGIETLRWDLRDIPLPFKDKSYDVLLLTDVLEHLNKIEDVNKLLSESNRIAKKKIIVLTPNVFVKNFDSIHNPYPYNEFTKDNKYQEHHLLIEKKYLKRKGFKVSKEKRKYWFAIKNNIHKILHVWDVAGVASTMCKYQNRLGYNAKLYSSKIFDTYGYSEIYKEHTITYNNPQYNISKRIFIKPIQKIKIYSIIKKVINQLSFMSKLKKFADDFEPDIMHFHVLDYIPIIFKMMGYKILIEFHGTRMRYKYFDGTINKGRKTPRWIFRLYQILGIPLFVSTPDLLRDIPDYNKPKERIKLIPNPVDADIFNESKRNSMKGMALYTLNKYDKDNLELAYIRAEKRDLTLCVQNRMENVYRKHLEFAEYLSHFEYFIDRMKIDSLSKTALESLAMGIKVVDWKDDTLEELPYIHNPDYVAELTVDIYDKIMVGII